nr:MAG TPA: hypothetical protein [Caudoviricetes sp.]
MFRLEHRGFLLFIKFCCAETNRHSANTYSLAVMPSNSCVINDFFINFYIFRMQIVNTIFKFFCKIIF